MGVTDFVQVVNVPSRIFDTRDKFWDDNNSPKAWHVTNLTHCGERKTVELLS
jgi:hypothetical protein